MLKFRETEISQSIFSVTDLLTENCYAFFPTAPPCTDVVGCIARVACFICSLYRLQIQHVVTSCKWLPPWCLKPFICAVTVPGVTLWGRIGISLTCEIEGGIDLYLWISDGDIGLPWPVWNEEITFSMLSMMIQSVDWITYLLNNQLRQTCSTGSCETYIGRWFHVFVMFRYRRC